MTIKLLLVFIHGFRGSDTSFKDFPNWLRSTLAHTLDGTKVETIVYPSYKTAGELSTAVQNFCTWLSDQIKDDDHVDIVLLGHSMGGIVGAETILHFNEGRRQLQPDMLLRNGSIIGLLAYDTPFYSINEGFVLKATSSLIEKIDRILPSTTSAAITTAVVGTNNSSSRSSSSSISSITRGATTTELLRLPASNQTMPAIVTSISSCGLFAGTLGALGLTAVGAYLTRGLISSTATIAFDHLEFISDLVDTEKCRKRMAALLSVPDTLVRCFYIKIPPSTNHRLPRTFITLPPPDTLHAFIPIVTSAESEIMAHITIFDPRKNDHYYTVGSDSISMIVDMVTRLGRRKQKQRNTTTPATEVTTAPTPTPSSSSSSTLSFASIPPA